MIALGDFNLGPSRFRKELLRDERRTVGRYDGRFEGIDFDAAGEEPASDPSETAITGAFTAAFNSYVAEELNYTHDTPYQVMNREVGRPGLIHCPTRSRTWPRRFAKTRG